MLRHAALGFGVGARRLVGRRLGQQLAPEVGVGEVDLLAVGDEGDLGEARTLSALVLPTRRRRVLE